MQSTHADYCKDNIEILHYFRNGFRRGKDCRIFCSHPGFFHGGDGQLVNEFPRGGIASQELNSLLASRREGWKILYDSVQLSLQAVDVIFQLIKNIIMGSLFLRDGIPGIIDFLQFRQLGVISRKEFFPREIVDLLEHLLPGSFPSDRRDAVSIYGNGSILDWMNIHFFPPAGDSGEAGASPEIWR
jgi:hypothetical protein